MGMKIQQGVGSLLEDLLRQSWPVQSSGWAEVKLDPWGLMCWVGAGSKNQDFISFFLWHVALHQNWGRHEREQEQTLDLRQSENSCFSSDRINLSPFTKDFRGEEQQEITSIFWCPALMWGFSWPVKNKCWFFLLSVCLSVSVYLSVLRWSSQNCSVLEWWSR